MPFSDVPLTYHASKGELDVLVRLKGQTKVSVVIPAQNEAPTIGAVLDAVNASNRHWPGVIDEVLVVDDHSSDDTATVAARHGATVVLRSSRWVVTKTSYLTGLTIGEGSSVTAPEGANPEISRR